VIRPIFLHGETETAASHDELKEAESMEAVCESVVQAVSSHCEKTLAEIRAHLEEAKMQIGRIGRLELRVAQVTSSVGQRQTQIVAQIQSMADWNSELANSLDKVD
jgi:transcription termination factor NusB